MPPTSRWLGRVGPRTSASESRSRGQRGSRARAGDTAVLRRGLAQQADAARPRKPPRARRRGRAERGLPGGLGERGATPEARDAAGRSARVATSPRGDAGGTEARRHRRWHRSRAHLARERCVVPTAIGGDNRQAGRSPPPTGWRFGWRMKEKGGQLRNVGTFPRREQRPSRCVRVPGPPPGSASPEVLPGPGLASRVVPAGAVPQAPVGSTRPPSGDPRQHERTREALRVSGALAALARASLASSQLARALGRSERLRARRGTRHLDPSPRGPSRAHSRYRFHRPTDDDRPPPRSPASRRRADRARASVPSTPARRSGSPPRSSPRRRRPAEAKEAKEAKEAEAVDERRDKNKRDGRDSERPSGVR